MIMLNELHEKADNLFKSYCQNKITGFFSDAIDSFFPLEIRANKGKVNDDIRQRAKELEEIINNSKEKKGRGYSLEIEKIQSRTNGVQTAVRRIYFSTEEDYLTFISKKKNVNRLENAARYIKENLNSKISIQDWCLKHIQILLEEQEESYWENIILCVNWLNENQDSGIYIRNIQLPVHTKFIENNKGIIKSLSDNAECKDDFETTFGLKAKPERIRVRSLDNAIKIEILGKELEECTFDIEDFALLPEGLTDSITSIIIVENEMVYLTFPDVAGAICLWGHGFTVNILKTVGWLKEKQILYFGDLDEHGFEILSTLRASLPQAKTFCMEKSILEKYDRFLVKGVQLAGRKIPENLTDAEKETFMILRNAPIEKSRLEQERITNIDIKNSLFEAMG